MAGAQALNIPANAAVECRDRPHYRAPVPDGADVQLHGICSDWSALGPPPVVPAGTAIPTLVLAGQFDPNLGPALSRRVAGQLGEAARWVEFPLIGHNVRHFSPCAVSIVAAFIDKPEQAPKTACAQRPAPIHFLPR